MPFQQYSIDVLTVLTDAVRVFRYKFKNLSNCAYVIVS